MSRTVCTYPIAAAILKADDILGRGRVWRPASPTQKRYLRDFHAPQAPEVASIPEIESLASFSAADINAWLAARRFNITLDPFPKHGFGTASVLDVAVQWLEDGQKRPITLADSRAQVPGVLLKPGVTFIEHSRLGVVASIETKSGDIVNLAAADLAGPFGLDLMDLVTERGTVSPCRTYRGVVFPMVDLDEKPDISWLIGMNTVGEDKNAYEIAQAVQQTKFKMNDKGARAKSAVALGMKTTSMAHREPPPYVIDRPFLVWIERPGLSKPFFVGHITQENFKDPGSLDDM